MLAAFCRKYPEPDFPKIHSRNNNLQNTVGDEVFCLIAYKAMHNQIFLLA